MKFLKKKGVRIGMIITAALLLALIIYFCVRPVSVGYSYTGTTKVLGKEVTSTYHFNSFNKVTIDGSENWYFEKDGLVVVMGSTKLIEHEDFKSSKDAAIENWNCDVAELTNPKFTAFGAEILGVNYTCVGAIVTVVIMAVVELGLISLIVLSFANKKKKRK